MPTHSPPWRTPKTTWTVRPTTPTNSLNPAISLNPLFPAQPNLAASAANLREVLALCSAEHGTAGGNEEAAANSFVRSLDVLRRAGLLGVGN